MRIANETHFNGKMYGDYNFEFDRLWSLNCDNIWVMTEQRKWRKSTQTRIVGVRSSKANGKNSKKFQKPFPDAIHTQFWPFSRHILAEWGKFKNTMCSDDNIRTKQNRIDHSIH